MGFHDVVSGLKNAFGFSAEKKAFVLSDPAISEVFGVRSTITGVNVGGMSALNIPAVLQAVRLISESVGSLPVKLFRERGEAKEAANEHPAYKIVHRRANEWTGATTLRTDLTADALIYGNGFARVVRYQDGRPFELIRLLPGTVSVIEDTLGAARRSTGLARAAAPANIPIPKSSISVPSSPARRPLSAGKQSAWQASLSVTPLNSSEADADPPASFPMKSPRVVRQARRQSAISASPSANGSAAHPAIR